MSRSSRQGAHKDLVDGIPPEGTSLILTTNVDGFIHEEMPHLAAVTEVGARAAPPNPKGSEGSEDDPSLLLQDDKVQNVDWVIEGVEKFDADACCHMLAFYTNLKDWYR